MKLEVYTKHLQETLKKVFKLAPKKSTLEVLNKKVYIQVQDNNVLVGASDLESMVTMKLRDTWGTENGTIVLDENNIKLINKMDSDTITITDREILAGKRKLKFANEVDTGIVKTIFNFKEKFNTEVFSVTKNDFDNLLSVTFASSKTDMTPILKGVLIRNGKAITTDRHRLAIKDFPASNANDIVIGNTLVDYTGTLIDKKFDGIFTGTTDTDGRYLRIEFDNVTITTRLLEGNYPDVSKIIPTSFESVTLVDGKELETELKLSLEVGSKDELIKLQNDVDNHELKLITSNEDNSLESSILAHEDKSNQFSNMDIHIKAGMLLDGIKHLNMDKVEIGYNGKFRPLFINNCYIVMPYRVS